MRPRTILILGLLLTLGEGRLAAQEYSTTPLAGPAAYPRDGLPKDPAAWLAWLASPPAGADRPEPQVLLEHTYALIGARVRDRFQHRGEASLPPADSILAGLFAAAEQLGAIGAGQVATALGRPTPASQPIPSEFSLQLQGSEFVLISATGRWRLVFPYYFMVGNLQRTTLNDGTVSNIAVVSTLTAADSGTQSGASQGTLLIVSNEEDDLPRLAASWLNRLGISPDDTTSRVVPQATRSYRTFSKQEQLGKEMSAFRIPSGSLLVVYSGLQGTYETNRVHYVDLTRSMRVRQ